MGKLFIFSNSMDIKVLITINFGHALSLQSWFVSARPGVNGIEPVKMFETYLELTFATVTWLLKNRDSNRDLLQHPNDVIDVHVHV